MNWISIKEQLPPIDENGESEEVLLTDCDQVFLGHFYGDESNGYNHISVSYEVDWELTATHWMEIPKLPCLK